MPVYKDKKTNTWYFSARYKDYAGKSHQTTRRGFPLKRDAEKALAEFMTAQQFDDKTTFKQAAEAYISEVTPIRKIATINSYRHWLGEMKQFHDLPLASITPQIITAWYNDLLSRYSQRSIDLIFTHFRTFYRYGIKRAGLVNDAIRLLPRQQKLKTKQVNFWTINQYEQFRAVVDDAYFLTLFDLLYFSGMRHGELRGLTLADVDLESCSVSILRTRSEDMVTSRDIVNSPKTPSGIRDIVIPGFVRDELASLISGLYDPAPSDWIFNSSMQVIRKKFYTYTEKAGLPRIHVHDLRHSHVSLLIYLNFSPVAIASRLGHEDVKTTLNTYSHMYPNQQNDMAAALTAAHLSSNEKVTILPGTSGKSI